jgi:hypothetical protein
VDQQLSPNTTYYYQVTALNTQGAESAPTATVAAVTAGDPPACDAYFSDNIEHVANLRAYVVLFEAFALGSNDDLGPYNDSTFNELIKKGPLNFSKMYCP